MTQSNILFNHRVIKITHTDSGVEVLTNQGIFEADRLIITVSIGVLNSGLIQFEPELPSWKTKALAQCKMSTYCKIFVKFSHQFWGSKKRFFIASKKRGYYPYFISRGEGIAICIVTGEEAKRVEKLTN
jgi:polyamine oxidase